MAHSTTFPRGIPDDELDLSIEKVGDDYRVHARDGSGASGVEPILLPLGTPGFEERLAELVAPRRLRRIDPPDRRAAREVGAALSEAIFKGQIRDVFITALQRVLLGGQKLRLRLTLENDPRLTRAPWELLCDPRSGEFLALGGRVHLVRSPYIVESVQRTFISGLLRVLAVVACPRDVGSVDAEVEWRRLDDALREAAASGRFALEKLAPATRSALAERLRRDDVHVLHFVGHGEFDETIDEGVLFLEDAQGRADRVRAGELAVLLGKCRAVRLVVLNACEGCRAAGSDFFDGVAQSLLRAGVPAVVAMQFPISEAAALDFASSFYPRLADGPVDEAVTDARRAMFFNRKHDVEWATPVLYLRTPSGRIFERNDATSERATEGVLATLPLAAPSKETDESPTGQRRKRLAGAVARLLFVALGVGAPLAIAWFVWQQLRPHPPPPPLVTGDPRCPEPAGLDMPFAYVREGAFNMGSGREPEKPLHRVTLSRPLCVGAYEVTQAQWDEVMGEPRETSPERGRLPVGGVSWDDAKLFLEKLNEREPGVGYRLLTEAEWEYAARAGTTTRFSFGDEASGLHRYGNCIGREGADSFAGPAPVGSFEPNGWGLFDMYGNVSEWVADRYGEYPDAPVIDPRGPPTGLKRVRRGGSWVIKGDNCRSSARTSSGPIRRGRDVGFRIARDVPDLRVSRR